MSDDLRLDPPRSTVKEEDIVKSDVPRRSFLRGIGILAGTAVVTTGAAGCASMSGSDRCDPIRSDNDPSDPIGSASDSDNAPGSCDSD